MIKNIKEGVIFAVPVVIFMILVLGGEEIVMKVFLGTVCFAAGCYAMAENENGKHRKARKSRKQIIVKER